MGIPRAIDRIRALPPVVLDRLLALVLFAALELEIVLGKGYDDKPLDAAAALLLALPVAWRRRRPLTAVAAFVAAVLVQEALGGDLVTHPVTSFVIALILVYSVAAHGDRDPAVAGLAIMLGGTWAALLAQHGFRANDLFAATALYTLAWLAGRALRNHRLLAIAMQERAAQLVRERERDAEQAISQERARIASELHDVVAHNVSVMVVQAGAARRIVERDPDAARDALESIEQTGRTALTEMRRLLGVLRQDERRGARDPQPSVADVDGLLDDARTQGLGVQLRVEGERQALPQGIDLSAYRIVQEGLANAVEHAHASRAEVVLRYGDRWLEVEVDDDGRGPSGNGVVHGQGLLGIRERVALYGGSMQTGTSRDGGFSVRARLPLDASQR